MAKPSLPTSFCNAILQSCQGSSEDWGDAPFEPSAGISYMVATVATGTIANRLGVNIQSELDDLHQLLKRSTGKRPSPKVLQSIREYFPAWQPTSGGSCVPERYTLDVLEKLVLNVLCRRESPQRISAARPCKEMVSEYVALWTWDEQEWWRVASKRLGSDGCRAFIAGIMRSLLHDLYKPRKIDAWVEEVLTAIENYALTGKRSSEIDKIAKKVASLEAQSSRSRIRGRAIAKSSNH